MIKPSEKILILSTRRFYTARKLYFVAIRESQNITHQRNDEIKFTLGKRYCNVWYGCYGYAKASSIETIKATKVESSLNCFRGISGWISCCFVQDQKYLGEISKKFTKQMQKGNVTEAMKILTDYMQNRILQFWQKNTKSSEIEISGSKTGICWNLNLLYGKDVHPIKFKAIILNNKRDTPHSKQQEGVNHQDLILVGKEGYRYHKN